jgi:hypothetical protein
MRIPGTPFQRVFVTSNFQTAATVVLTSGQYNRLGTFTVPAGQVCRFGANEAYAGTATGATAYLKVCDATNAAITGTVRFVVSNSTGTRTSVVLEQRTEKLSASQTDRTLAQLIPEMGVAAQRDDLLYIEFKPDTTSTWQTASTDTKLLIPVTVYQ